MEFNQMIEIMAVHQPNRKQMADTQHKKQKKKIDILLITCSLFI